MPLGNRPPSRDELREASGSEYVGKDTFGLLPPPKTNHPRYRTLRPWWRVFYGMSDERPGLARADARFLLVTFTSTPDLSFAGAAEAWKRVARRLRERWPDLIYVATRDYSGNAGFHVHAVMFRPVPLRSIGRGGWSIKWDDIEWLIALSGRAGFSNTYVDVQGRERGKVAIPRQLPRDRMQILNYLWNRASALPQHREQPGATVFYASHGIGPHARQRIQFPLDVIGDD